MKTSSMKSLSRWMSAIMVALILTTGCGSDDGPGTPEANPEVTGFSPVEVVAGTTVAITGQDFPTDPSAITVTFFDGVVATIVSATSTEIVVTVPEGAESGAITVEFNGESFTTSTDADVRMDIPRDGLVAFYPFTGNANDESTNSNDGTVNGATLTADRYGNPNSAYSFDGVDDFIEVADDATLDITSAITMSAWVSLSDFYPTSILGKANFQDNSYPGYAINVGASEGFWVGIVNDNFIGNSSSVGGLNQWHHVVTVYDGSKMTVYLNNNIIVESNFTATIGSNNSSLFIGDNPVQSAVDGVIDDVAIYNRALSADEVSTLYNQTLTE